jgi:hypothetical protein
MAKKSGLGQQFYLDGVDLSGDTGSASAISAPRQVQVATGINKFAIERLHLPKDGSFDWSSYFNPSGAHAELSTLPTGDRIANWLTGTTLGDPAFGIVCKQLSYDPTRAADGSMTIAVQGRANGFGLEWGDTLTAGAEDFTGAANGDGVDLAASTNFGLQAYLQVLEFTGTDVTVTLQDSSDGSSDWAAIGAGVAFAAASAVGAQRIQTARNETIRRHLRIVVSGTFTSATLAVVVVKNTVETLF